MNRTPMLLLLLPYRKMSFSTPLGPEAIAERLALVCSPKHRWFGRFRADKKFTGNVSPKEFRIVRTFGGRNTYLPLVRGRMRQEKGRTIITTVMTLQPIAGAVLIIFWAWLIYLFAALEHRVPFEFLCIMLMFHVVMCLVGFVPEARWAENTLKELTAQPEPDPYR